MNPKTKKILVIATIIIGVLAWAFVVARVYELRSQRHFAWRNYLMSHRRRPVTAGDISYIAPWMTFDYVTKIFNLPPTYLANDLSINNSKYPAITLMQYAKAAGTSTSAITKDVQTAVRKYLATSTPK